MADRMAGGGKRRSSGLFRIAMILISRRRPARPITVGIEEIKAIQDIPKPPEELPECRDEERQRDQQSE